MSQTGDVKRIPAVAFKLQKRNGKGVKNEDDAVLDIISTNTIDTLMVFTDKGKMYRILVDNLPVGTNVSKGVRINTLINMEPDEKVIAITSLYRKTSAKYVVFITKQGLFKKSLLEEYTTVKRNTGIQAIKLKEGDSIANVTFCNEEEFIVISKQGMSIRFETAAIAPIGRVTSGVKSIKLDEGDEVLVGLPIHKTTDSLAVFTKSGYGKKTAIEEFPIQGRGGKGLRCSGDSIIGAALVSDEDNILIVGVPNSICFSATDIPALGRVSLGNTMIKNSIVKKVVKI
jgi:DNA gyrase subunit A